jgi:hypothetical protein
MPPPDPMIHKRLVERPWNTVWNDLWIIARAKDSYYILFYIN